MYNIKVYLFFINIYFRFGLLRNLFLQFESQGKNSLTDKDGTVDKKHWYFLIEYLLIISGYSTGDLMFLLFLIGIVTMQR
jgi:hypothetical protein